MEGRRDWPLVLCRAGPHGLTLEARQGNVAVRHETTGTHTPETIAFRTSVLAQIEGRTQDSVGLEQVAFGEGVARWTEGDEPRTLEIETVAPESVPSFPEVPRRLAVQPPDFIRALAEAARTTPRDAGRPALSRVPLRGKESSLVATDGRQLFVQGGFRLPWANNLLVPRVPAFGVRGLLTKGDAVGVGTAGGQVAIRAGPWLFLLAIDPASRFPDIQTVMPKESAVTTRLRLDPADVALLADGLAKLPGGKEPHAPVTLVLQL